ncbi:MAG TPA: carboxypeptidase regulatory-like domain-containing protein [Candidatus Chromulinivoraceae bacterium]|nr:carboxypeptidase regulatory-like domain-containing protein [Candidatus Chromulinivoraceae bacterium]
MAKNKDEEIAEEAEKETPIEVEHEQEPSTELDSESSKSNEEETSHASEHLHVGKQNWFKRLWSTKKGKAFVIFLALLVIAGVLCAVPTTRYGILGNFVKKSVHVVVTDAETKKPVSQADISIAGKTAKTSATGEADVANVPVGQYTLKVAKNYYKDTEQSYTVPILSAPKSLAISSTATGRQVSIKVTNVITKAALAKANITVGNTSALTDDQGMVSIVLPTDKSILSGTVNLDGYNQSSVAVTVTDQPDKNNFTLTPAGSVYYLSNQTGVLNVMKSNLDGTNSAVVVKATGNEDSNNTSLLASRDWKYLAFLSHRTNDQAGQLYLVDTQTGAVKVIDQGDVSMGLVGWSGHHFIYNVYRNNVQYWQANRQALKSYDAETGTLTTIDQNASIGDQYNNLVASINTPYIVNDKVIYTISWSANGSYYYSNQASENKIAIMSVNPDGSSKQRIKDFDMQRYGDIQPRLQLPQTLYYKVSIDGGDAKYYSYNGTVADLNISQAQFYSQSNTYLLSPDGTHTFWSDYRDGKNTLLVGDKNASNPQTIASLSDYTAYGWFSNDYILLSKGGSELYIASAHSPLSATNQLLKVTNYYKPGYNYPGGYGSSYGAM